MAIPIHFSSHAQSSRFAAQFSSLGALLAMARNACAAACLGPELTRHVELVLEEAFTNTIQHGYHGESPENSVWLTCNAIPDAVRIRYQDAATPFDPLRAAIRRVEGQLGGLGCVFIRTLPNKADYQRRAGHNILKIEFIKRP